MLEGDLIFILNCRQWLWTITFSAPWIFLISCETTIRNISNSWPSKVSWRIDNTYSFDGQCLNLIEVNGDRITIAVHHFQLLRRCDDNHFALSQHSDATAHAIDFRYRMRCQYDRSLLIQQSIDWCVHNGSSNWIHITSWFIHQDVWRCTEASDGHTQFSTISATQILDENVAIRQQMVCLECMFSDFWNILNFSQSCIEVDDLLRCQEVVQWIRLRAIWNARITTVDINCAGCWS